MDRRIALTVDVEHPDRPGSRPDATDRLLDLLADADVRATFFVQGRWAEAYPVTARRIGSEGHLVGNHSFFHASLPLLTDEGLGADIGRAQAAVREATGVDPRPWFRCPFGDGIDDARVLGAIERLGYCHVGWDVDAGDWQPGRTVEEVAAGIVRGTLARETSIVLLHGWPPVTVAAVAAALRALRERGDLFVTVDELAPHQRTPGLPAEPATPP